jgi:peptidoglycan hydrolase-like protein with peptidoglycan-binding domain
MVCLTSDVVASGETVLGVQRALAKLGYTVATDGDCGPQTKGAISLFQKDNAITVTGVANATTITAIKSVLKGLDVESGDEDPVAWTNGCNAGSQDALLTIDSIVWKGSAYPAIHKNFQESASDTWHDGYRSCFMATLKKSGAEVDEDGNVSIPLGATPPTGSIIGEVLDESGAEDEEYTEEEVAEAEAEAPDYYW